MSYWISWNQLQQDLPPDLKIRAMGLQPVHSPITGVTMDSRRVLPGHIFVALAGSNTDGHRFIPDAIQRGAILIVGEQPIPDLPVPYLMVGDSRLALAHFSAAYFGLPARQLTVIGVTGTDGKTTTTNLIYQILLAAGIRAGMISTVNAVVGERELDTGFHVTTPEAPDIQNYLAQMVASGITHVVLEATSHGLAQHRVAGCEFDIGVVTNITHEHLDYHTTLEAYREAKARLFTSLAQTQVKALGNYRLAVLNKDDPSYDYLQSIISDHQPALNRIDYGIAPNATLRGEKVKVSPQGIEFTAVHAGESIPVKCSLVGEYNVSNCLAAIATTVIGLKLNAEAARQGIAHLAGIPGRMERIDLGQNFLAIVDFAHTPNALQVTLSTARSLVPEGGKVIAVFGSAGLRDRMKRRLMAELSAQLADFTVLTAEDPRTESIETILEEMAAGAGAKGGQEGVTYWRVPDRREAIRFGLRLAHPGDIVLALGKGHEQSMCFGDTEYTWDDRLAMRAALAELLSIPGPEMPYLPSPAKASER
jgi:UDP-N-acetylmuramoyl-L-alanyl-D-glutamate--2,6-diaminopimelate ligase